MPSFKSLRLEDIKATSSTQARAALSEAAVNEYIEAMRAGADFPPIDVFQDPQGTYWLADGFHRVAAAKQCRLTTIEASVRPGTERDAAFYACSANGTHGVRRTQEDKRTAVTRLLQDPLWGTMSDRAVAAHCHVSHTFVGQMRSSLAEEQAPLEPPRQGQPPQAAVPALPVAEERSPRVPARIDAGAAYAADLPALEPSMPPPPPPLPGRVDVRAVGPARWGDAAPVVAAQGTQPCARLEALKELWEELSPEDQLSFLDWAEDHLGENP